MSRDFDLGSMESTGSGLDAFFESNPSVVTPLGQEPTPVKTASKGRTKVASLSQLDDFVRTAEDTLIRKSTQDLWALKQEGGDFYIERMFDETGAPLKG